MNSYIQKIYSKGTSYSFRPKTDTLFKLGTGCYNFGGMFKKYIDIIINDHLKVRKTWKLFVEQFKTKPDGIDRKWRGEYWGKMMRGAVFTYIATGDEELYEVLCDTAEDMLTSQNDDGSFTTYTPEHAYTGWDMWSRKYVMLGFEYFLEICRDKSLSERIVKAICAHADHILHDVGEEEGKLTIFETSQNWRCVNSCSIIEPFVRLYNITENKKYLDFAGYIIRTGGSDAGNLFETAYRNELPPCEYPVKKAYEIMSCFEGVLEYYRATGIDKYKTAVLNFARAVMRDEITVIGCAGTWHEIFDNSVKYQIDYEHTGIMQETCVTVTWMKLCYQLLCLTGEEDFAQYFERAAYNAMPGAVNSDKVERYLSAFPFDSYNPVLFNARGRCSSGHNVMGINSDSEYGCCASIGSAGLGLIPITAVLASRDGFSFNMYIPGKVSTATPSDIPVSFDIITEYPKKGDIKIVIDGDICEEMTLKFRVPSYCRNAYLCLGGKKTILKTGEYACITREWKNGDVIGLYFDIPVRTFRTEGPKDYGDYHVALLKGPVALARDARLDDVDIDSIVDIVEDENGIVNAIESNDAGFDTNLEYKIPMKDGSCITVVDYASAGKTWDKESVLTVWMAEKKYWNVDLTKPLYIESINYTDRTYMTDIDGELRCFEKERNKAYKWRLIPCGEYYIIKAPNGKCVTAIIEGDKSYILLREIANTDNQLWRIEKFVQDRYQIISVESGCHLHEIRWDRELHRYRLYAFNSDADKRFSVREHISEQSVKSVSACTFKFSN